MLQTANDSRSGLQVHVRRKWWHKENGEEAALQDILFSVPAGKSLAVMGRSGSGKTTLLRLIAGLDDLFEGSVAVDGTEALEPDGRVQLVFQDNRLFDWMNVLENVCFAWEYPDAEQHKLAKDWITKMRLEHRLQALPKDLSEGQKKRVALARALVRPPRVLLLDEPLAGLDPPTADQICEDIRRLQAEHKFACVVTTHDPMEAISMCQSILYLRGHPAIGHGPVEYDGEIDAINAIKREIAK